jgi:hypothetical protein
MNRSGSGRGFGLVVLVVVTAVVLYLAVRAWQAVMPTASQLRAVPPAAADHEAGPPNEGTPPPPGVPSGRLPDLNDMRKATGAHGDRTREALEETD